MWILPTRNRQALCQRFLDVSRETRMESKGLVVIDGCEYHDLDLPENWQAMQTEHLELCGVLRKVFEDFPDEPFYGVVADDLVPKTPRWDKALEEAAGAWGIASCNDGYMAPERMAGATCLGGDLCRALGWIVPDGFVHLFIDDVWETVGKKLDCWTTLMCVLVEHHHFSNQKAKHDPTYRRVYKGQDFAQMDRNAFNKWRSVNMREDIDRAANLRGETRDRIRA